ncbi:MAG TPA: hypothetical protein VNL91_03220 [Thermoanaerobaculia bacterium]|nr:hypothetical protein [Thermoanaerobaculia bacterium]
MKPILIFLASAVIAAPALAQTSTFTIGPRYSNYDTDVDLGIVGVDTGRQSAFGLTGDYRSGAVVFDFMFDHDPENGISIIDILPLDVATYERDRGEMMVGYAALPSLDLTLGARFDTATFGTGTFDIGDLFSGADFDHQAIALGVNLHSPSRRPIGVYAQLRGYIGSGKIEESGVRLSSDTTGFRVEGGVLIPIGESSWSVAPAVEWETLEADDLGLKLNTNRLIVAFVYRSRP